MRILPMSSSSSESGRTSSSDSLSCCVESDFHVEIEQGSNVISGETEAFNEVKDVIQPYVDEPLASEEWLRAYEEKKQVEKARNVELTVRFDGKVALKYW